MITEAWVRAEIERAMDGPATRENVYDLAALIGVLSHIRGQAAAVFQEGTGGHSMAACPEESEEERRQREAVILTSYSADLNTRPRIEQIYDALEAVDVQTPEEHKKAQDARTWADILGGAIQ